MRRGLADGGREVCERRTASRSRPRASMHEQAVVNARRRWTARRTPGCVACLSPVSPRLPGDERPPSSARLVGKLRGCGAALLRRRVYSGARSLKWMALAEPKFSWTNVCVCIWHGLLYRCAGAANKAREHERSTPVALSWRSSSRARGGARLYASSRTDHSVGVLHDPHEDRVCTRHSRRRSTRCLLTFAVYLGSLR